MTRKIISWLPLWAVFLFTLSSCVPDEVYSASDPESEQYHSKSPFKEDEKYIKNVISVYEQNENRIKKISGTPLWDYATSMGNLDETFLIVPVADGRKVVACIQVPRSGDMVSFIYDHDNDHIRFFQAFINAKQVRPLKQSVRQDSSSEVSRICQVMAISMWYPDDSYVAGGYWETNVITKCENSGGTDPSDPNPGNPPTYPYPGGAGGGQNPQTPPNPCEKMKTQKNDAAYGLKIDFLKGKTNETFEYGFRVGNTINGSGQPETKYQQLSNAVGTHSLDFKIFPNTFGFMHSHFQGLVPVFSPDDINNFIKMLKNAANNNISLDTIYMTLVNPDGTTYQLWGSNDINVSNLSIFDQHTIDDVLNDIYTGRKYDLAKANQSPQFYQENFLKFMKEYMNVDGTKMYSFDNNGNALQLSLNGNSLATPIPCPN